MLQRPRGLLFASAFERLRHEERQSVAEAETAGEAKTVQAGASTVEGKQQMLGPVPVDIGYALLLAAPPAPARAIDSAAALT